MAECDSNYLRLSKLFPELECRDSSSFGVDLNGNRLDVHLEVVERAPYTTLLRLTQAPGMPFTRTPMLLIRMYHDARSAEVVEYQGERHFRAVYDYPNEDMHQPDEKAQINRFLGEFLALCLKRGISVGAPLLTD